MSVLHISNFLDPRYKDLEHETNLGREDIRKHVKKIMIDNVFYHGVFGKK